MSYRTLPLRNPLSIAIITALSFTASIQVLAEEDAAKQKNEIIDEVISVGTRAKGRTVAESLVPVDVISENTIQSSGATDTVDMLRKLAPSFNLSNPPTADGQDLMRPATLRSMAPDQTLVLINGKRRHQQALIAVQENVGRGSAGTDLSAIPLSAIARVEILRDGAAAQYGSDAIAGVMNIILKDTEGGDAWVQYGQTSEGDGDTVTVGINYGFLFDNDATLNITYEYVDDDGFNRANPTNWFGASPTVRQLVLHGEAETSSDSLWGNFKAPVGDGEFYAFGGYTKKEGESLGFYRGPGDSRVWSELFPAGVTPGLGTETEDESLGFGYSFLIGEWNMDISYIWGENRFEFRNTNSLNASYGVNSPTMAYDGALITHQTTFNFDAVRSLDINLGTTLAMGVEYREDGYEQEAGDPVSYNRGPVLCDENFEDSTDPGKDPLTCEYMVDGEIVNGTTVPGMQGFQGYSPDMVIDTDRDSWAFYVDVESTFTDRFTMGAAVRYEHYSDFGSTTNGKISGRYELTERVAVRGAVSTGFRAPGVQQKHFTQRSISLDNGVLADLVTLRPDSSLAADFGFTNLQEETSDNYSMGITYTGDTWTSTLDVYRIDIEDRIVYSGNISRGLNAAVDAIFDANDAPGQLLDGVANVSIFTNAIDTETTGMDWVNSWNLPLNNGNNLTLEATLHLNNTKVTGVNTSSSIVPDSVVFNESLKLLLTDGQPGERGTLSATYNADKWSSTLRITHFGEVSSSGYGSLPNTWDAENLVDLTGIWDITEKVKLSVGILNLFDTYPEDWGANGFPFPDLGFRYGWATVPFSLAGREYYLRANVKF